MVHLKSERAGLLKPRGRGSEESAENSDHIDSGQMAKALVFILRKLRRWEGPQGFKHRTGIFFFFLNHHDFRV